MFRLVESAAQPQVPVLRETKFSGAQNMSLPFHVDISPAGRVVVALREGFKRPFLIRGRGVGPLGLWFKRRGEVGPKNILKWTTNYLLLLKNYGLRWGVLVVRAY